MNVQKIIKDAIDAGVALHVVGGTVKVRGTPEAVAAVKIKLRPYKAAILKYLTAAAKVEPEVWGEYTPYCPPRPPVEWIKAITELDSLIDRYCEAAKLSPEARARILAARLIQPLASIPESIAWFQGQVAAIKDKTKETK